MGHDHITPLGVRFAVARDWGEILVMDSASSLHAADAGCFLVAGSHCSAMVARLTIPDKPRAVICNDAGVGKADVGVSGLPVFDAFGIPAAAADCLTARIGDGHDMIDNGRISRASRLAQAAGVRQGMPVPEAMDLMARWVLEAGAAEPVTRVAEAEGFAVFHADTVSFLDDSHAGGIHVVGSHGSDVTGTHMLRLPSAAGFANDAGGGKADAGFAGMLMLEEKGVPGATYSHMSAEIGNGRDAWENGVLSRVNAPAKKLGLQPGMTVQEAVARVAAALKAEERT